MDLGQRHPHPDIGRQPGLQPHHRGAFIDLHPHLSGAAKLMSHLLAQEFIMLRPAQACVFRRFIGIERNPQLAINFTTKRRGHHQLGAILQLQLIGHQHTHFVGQYFIKLLETRQDREIQYHQIGRHQADEQQGDDQEQCASKGAARRKAHAFHALEPSGTKT